MKEPFSQSPTLQERSLDNWQVGTAPEITQWTLAPWQVAQHDHAQNQDSAFESVSKPDIQQLKTELSAKTDGDVETIRRLQKECDEALGIQRDINDKQSDTIRAYNIVLDRFNIWKDVLSEHALSEQERSNRLAAFFKNVEWQMVTNLRERNHVAANPFQLHIRESKLYNEYLNTTPLEEIYWRGVVHRKKISTADSDESSREEAEFEGFLKLQQLFAHPDTPIGTKRIVISPPGLAKETPYTQNYVDILELKRDPVTHKRYIQAMRYSTTLNNQQYKDKAVLLDPEYYTGHKTGDTRDDAVLLSSPIVPETPYATMSADDIHQHVFGGDSKGMRNDVFETIVLTDDVYALIHRYIKTISRPSINWPDAAKEFNTILKHSDELVERSKNRYETVRHRSYVPGIIYDYRNIHHRNDYYSDDASHIQALVERLGTQQIRSVAGGCGNSDGYGYILHESLYHGIQDPMTKLSANSVTKYGLENTDYMNDPYLCRCGGKEPHFHCPGKNGGCNHMIPVGKGIVKCTECGQGKTC